MFQHLCVLRCATRAGLTHGRPHHGQVSHAARSDRGLLFRAFFRIVGGVKMHPKRDMQRSDVQELLHVPGFGTWTQCGYVRLHLP